MNISERKLKEMEIQSRTAEKIAKDAANDGMWIFDWKYKTWYSPEEFAILFKDIPRGDPCFQHIEIMDPAKGVIGAMEKLRRDVHHLDNLLARLDRYYKKEISDLKRKIRGIKY